MLRFKDSDLESEEIQEWPDGRRVTTRTREKVREIGLDWEFLKTLRSLSLRQIANTVLRELIPRFGLFLFLRELLEDVSAQF
jgi:ribosomal protein L30/L7E